LDRSHPGDLRSHSLYDAPTSDQRAERDRCLANEHYPKRHVEVATEMTLREEQYGNNAHGLLGIIAAMTQRDQRRCGKLQPLECRLYRMRICANKSPRHRQD